MKGKGSHACELIGKEVQIVSSANKSFGHIQGKVIDETKWTIVIRQQGKIKTLLKNAVTLKILPTGQLIVGKDIIKRPEDRVTR